MADVTGPISTLPGSRHKPSAGTKCDDCDKPAVIRIQGETDSMGSEMNDYCLTHGMQAENRSALSGDCDWCHISKSELKPIRDMDEGMCGPVYYVCAECRRKCQEKVLKEYNEMINNSDYFEF